MNSLYEIYQNLSAGMLTKKEALEQIRALKHGEDHTEKDKDKVYTLVVSPKWKAVPNPRIGASVGLTDSRDFLILVEGTDVSYSDKFISDLQNSLKNTNIQKWKLTADNIADNYLQLAMHCFEVSKSVLEGRPAANQHFQIVLTGSITENNYLGISAFFKTVSLENPLISGQCIHLDSPYSVVELCHLLKNERDDFSTYLIKYLNSERYILSGETVASYPSDETAQNVSAAESSVIKDCGVYIITGGLGKLGSLFASYIFSVSDKARVIITGRTKASLVLDTVAWKQLAVKKRSIEYVQLDLKNAEQVAGLVQDVIARFGKLSGVLHAAGQTSDSFALKKTEQEFEETLAPKVKGTFNLYLALQEIEFDFLALFSSVASWFGNIGQADYAAANGFMDNFASTISDKLSGQVVSINWPYWRDGGMSLDHIELQRIQKTTGLVPLDAQNGISAFERCLSSSKPQLMVLAGELEKLEKTVSLSSVNIKNDVPVDAQVPIVPKEGNSSTSALVDNLHNYLVEKFASLLKLPIEKVKANTALDTYGIDSVIAIELTNTLEKDFGSLPKTLFFEYQTIAELAEYFVASKSLNVTRLFDDSPKKLSTEPVTRSDRAQVGERISRQRAKKVDNVRQSNPHQASNDPIAIVGLSGRYPGAYNLDEYWENLSRGKNCITEIPSDRWDWRKHFTEDRTLEGHHYSKWGGFIDGVAEFDPRFFKISPREASSIDPQERLILQHAWLAIEDGGYTRERLQIPRENTQNGQVGVYVGVMYGEYKLSGSLASIANRVSYFLDLHGPSMTLDTMCSSSLTALHLACLDLKSGRTDLALAGGVNVTVHPSKYQMLSDGQFISSDGQCQSFGEGGDGYIPGEGVGLAVLKRLSEAERDGNQIYGVIRGTALNHGGKNNGFTVPNPRAQADAITMAFADSGVSPTHVSYIEAHGTGTKLGDPIEISALDRVFKRDSVDLNKKCLIGSAKSNIGHCESAAGIAGVSKVLLQMKHKLIVPSLHSDKLNPNIDFASSHFEVNQTLKSWPATVTESGSETRIAGVSSFGAGGSNAHILLEQYVPGTMRADTNSNSSHEQLIVISARTQPQLKQKIKDLIVYLSTSKESDVDFDNIAYTLQVGREPMTERFACVVRSATELLAKLKSSLSDTSLAQGFYWGVASEESYENIIVEYTKLEDVASQWVNGKRVNWDKLPRTEPLKIVSLPAYPFERKVFWNKPDSDTNFNSSSNVLHPLVHTNTSNLYQQKFESRFSGDESFVSNWPDKKALSKASLMEMAAASIERSIGSKLKNGTMCLRNLVFADDYSLDDQSVVSIFVFPAENHNVEFEISVVSSELSEEPIVICQGCYDASFSKDTDQIDIPSLISTLTKVAPILTEDMGIDCYEDGQQLLCKGLTVGNSPELALSRAIEQSIKIALSWMGKTLQEPIADLVLTHVQELQICTPLSDDPWLWLHNVNKVEDSILFELVLIDSEGLIKTRLVGAEYNAINEPIIEAISDVSQSSQTTKQVLASPGDLVLQNTNSPGEVVSNVNLVRFESASIESPAKIRLLDAVEAISLSSLPRSADKVVLPMPSGIGAPSNTPKDAAISLKSSGSGIFQLSIKTTHTSADITCQEILHTLTMLQANKDIKVLSLSGIESIQNIDHREWLNTFISSGLLRAVVELPYPTIASVDGKLSGVSLLFASVCDFLLISDESLLELYADNDAFELSSEEFTFLSERYGNNSAQWMVRSGSTIDVQSFAERGLSLPVYSADQLNGKTLEFCQNLANKNAKNLRLLKEHLIQPIKNCVANFKPVTKAKSNRKLDGVKLKTTRNYKHLKLQIHELNVLEVCLIKSESDVLCASLDELVDLLSDDAWLSNTETLILRSEWDDFVPLGEQHNFPDWSKLTDALLAKDVPIVCYFDKSSSASAWLLGMVTDAIVLNPSGEHGCDSGELRSDTRRLFSLLASACMPKNLAQTITFTQRAIAFSELKKWSNIYVPDGARGFSAVRTVAVNLAKSAWLPIKRLKKERIADAKSRLVAYSYPKPEGASKHSEITIKSSVIDTEVSKNGVITITLKDTNAKNMFSNELIDGINEVFNEIKNNDAIKVVVITGYDNYFASGGTKESLLAIQKGTAKFTDTQIFRACIDCEIPVIAAMQGHGIGAGWVLGMLADFPMLSEESRYISPYMNYGFTPGAGSTYAFPMVAGNDIARETLFTARENTGLDLKERAIAIPVLSRKNIFKEATELANQIAKHDRNYLVTMKHALTANMLSPLAEACERELAMHEQTFVGQEDTLKTIEAKFDIDTQQILPSVVPPQSAQSVSGPSESAIKHTLQKLLATELHLDINEINDTTQFVDLGLDSITGVSWVRKINNAFGTAIEATKVYNFPTIADMSAHVVELTRGEVSTSEEQSVELALPETRTRTAPAPVQGRVPLAARADIVASLKQMLAQELHMELADITETAQFVDLGLDSITGVSWIRKINEKYSTSIDATKVYSYPSLAEMAAYVVDIVGSELPKVAEVAPEKTIEQAKTKPVYKKNVPQIPRLVSMRKIHQRRFGRAQSVISMEEPIAIVGMAGQFPKANNLDIYWQNIATGRDCISEIPRNRWDIKQFYQEGPAVEGKTNSKWMGLLEEYDLFDPLFFNISPTEARGMDPQQRLFLQACWQGIESAGYSAKALSGSKCGVFVGCAGGDYNLQSHQLQLSTHGFTGSANSILAARISYFMNLQGPCLAIDTACSSSLVSIAYACDSLNSKGSDIALAGGVYVSSGPTMHIMTTQTGMLSGDGRCFSFDERANGFVPGEAVGVLVLKRMADAIRDRDIVHGVIEGWGINQDGKTNGITAPNPASQTRLQSDVYQRFGIDPGQIQLIEAHGTGTKLGDPIEVEGLRNSFKPYTNNKQFCALGSVKSNIGHCLTAAGISGFTKILLALKHKQLPPTINFQKLNKHIDLSESPFYINTALKSWDILPSECRRAAISSFGFGGTNAHLVVAEYPQNERVKRFAQAVPLNDCLVPLSAKTPEQLLQRARDLAVYLANANQDLSLADLAYTLQIGRDEMDERAAILANSIEDLDQKLNLLVAGDDSSEHIFRGKVLRNNEGLNVLIEDEELKNTVVEKYLAQRKYGSLLNLWVRGFEFDWYQLYGTDKPNRVDLPTYPFAKEKYWVNESKPYQIGHFGTVYIQNTKTRIHPLLHENISSLSAYGYASTFDGQEAFFSGSASGDVQQGNPWVVVDFVLAANGLLSEGAQSQIYAENMRWHNPIQVIKEPIRIETALRKHLNNKINLNITLAGLHKTAVPIASAELDLRRAKPKNPIIAEYTAGLALTKLPSVSAKNHKLAKKAWVGDNELIIECAPQELDGCQYLGDVLKESLELWGMLKASTFQIELLEPASVARMVVSAYTNNIQWVRLVQSGEQHSATLAIQFQDAQGNLVLDIEELALAGNWPAGNGLSKSRFLAKTGKQWLCLDESWQARPLKNDVDWLTKIVAKDGQKITLISDNKRDYDAFVRVSQQLQKLTKRSQALWKFNHSQITRNATESVIGKIFDHVNDNSDAVQTIFLLLRCRENDDEIKASLEAVYLSVHYLIKTAAKRSVQFYLIFKGNRATTTYFDALAGFFKSAMMEAPNHRYRSIGIGDTNVSEELFAKQVMQEWLLDDTHSYSAACVPMLRYRGQVRELLELSLAPHIKQNELPHVPFRQGGTYLMVGALGDVGELICQELGRRYRCKLVILSRRDRDSASSALRKISDAGATVIYHSVDILNKDALEAVMNQIKSEDIAFNGVIHMARSVSDAAIANKPFDDFYETMSIKANGTVMIDSVTASESLDFFLMFSSMASFGIKGSPDYAYATAFQNAFARNRNYLMAQGKRKGKAYSICWGQWEKDGAVNAKLLPDKLKRLQTMGVDLIDPSAAMGVMEVALSQGDEVQAYAAVSDIGRALRSIGIHQIADQIEDTKIKQLIEGYQSRRLSKFEFANALASFEIEQLSNDTQNLIVKTLKEVSTGNVVSIMQSTRKIQQQQKYIAQLPPTSVLPESDKAPVSGQSSKASPMLRVQTDTEERTIGDRIRIKVSGVLGLNANTMDLEKSFQEYGMDSITAAQVSVALEKEFERSIPPHWLIEYACVNALAKRLNQSQG